MPDGSGWARVRVAPDVTVTTLDNPWSRGEAQYLYDEVFTHDDYLIDLPPLRPGCVVVDVGANLGLFALRVARSCPDARLTVVEPVPVTCALLRRNLADAGIACADVWPVAVGARAGRATVTVYRHLLANSTSRPGEKPAAWVASMRALEPERADELLATVEIDVEVVALSAVLPANADRIDLLKIDVEGAELDALRGVDDRDWARIEAVAVEVHDVDGRLDAVLDLLRRRGLRCSVRPPAMLPAELDHHIVTAGRAGRRR